MNFYTLLITLSLTLLIEYPIVQILWIVLSDNEVSISSKFTFWKNRIIIIPAIIVNVLTNPAINIFANYLRILKVDVNTFWIIITLIEFVIWAFEGMLYKFMLKTSWKIAFAMAITANFVSYMVSFII